MDELHKNDIYDNEDIQRYLRRREDRTDVTTKSDPGWDGNRGMRKAMITFAAVEADYRRKLWRR